MVDLSDLRPEGQEFEPRAELLEAWLALTSIRYHDNILILMLLNQWLALTMLRTTGPWSVHLTLTVLLSTQVYKWEPANCFGDNQTKCWEVTLRWTSIPSRGSRNTPSRFILQKPEISAGNDEPSGLLGPAGVH